ncbi:uncharacterized protein METZ01_LOCUS58547 [marine metagenome]|uniref:Uncharacterized protein n=1 Tax=marine metagenome TaxID=408172 RepID=A0A381SWG7_9ZZZZ
MTGNTTFHLVVGLTSIGRPIPLENGGYVIGYSYAFRAMSFSMTP